MSGRALIEIRDPHGERACRPSNRWRPKDADGISVDEHSRVRGIGARHVRFEERQHFPAMEAALDAETLGRLAKSIEEAEAD